MDDAPGEPIGELLLERFATQNILASCRDSKLLTIRPRLSSGVHLVEESIQQGETWEPKRMYLERRSGLTRRLAFDWTVAGFVARFDGHRPLRALAAELAKQNNLPCEQAEANGLQLVRKLASLGLVTLDA
jgi:hypothetical protein